MNIDELDNNRRIKVSYCLLCDASAGGENSFLRWLGDLQRDGKVELSLGSCKCDGAPPNLNWKIAFDAKDDESGK
jgi:hypothetical protein